MSSKAARILGHPPGLNFRPDDDELVEFFLLPRVRGEPAWFPGVVVIDDDTAANTHPLKLLERHGLVGDNNAYFFVHTTDAAGRQDRYCAGGGRWVSQRPVPKGSCIGGEEIKWRRVNLNLQTSRGKSGGGSNGWVMHEYSLTDPPCPFLKICHVTFSGHGKDSKRVPDGEADSEPAAASNKRARVAAADSGSSKTTKIPDQDPPSVVAHASSTCQVYGSTAPAMDQGYGACCSIGQGMSAISQPGQSSTWSIPFAVSAGGADVYLEQVPLTTQQHQPVTQQLQPAQSYSATCAYGSMTTVADQDYSSAAAAHAYAGQEPGKATDEEALEWFKLRGNDLLADAAEPTAEHSMVPQLMPSGEDEGISPTTSNHQLLDGTYLPADVQVQPDESSFWGFPSAADLFLDTSTVEPQEGLDEEEQRFWRSIGVDTNNIAAF